MNKVLGNLNKGIGTVLDYFFEILIIVVDFLVNIFKSFQQLILSLLVFGGCIFFFIFLNPFFWAGIKRWQFIFILLIFFFPLVGTTAVSYLKYIQYMVTEYFYEKADYYLLGKDRSYSKIGDYGRRYQRKKEQEKREKERIAWEKEQERRRKQEEAFKRKFEDFMGQGGGGFSWQYGPYGQQQQQQGGYGGQQNMGGFGQDRFKEKYEDAIGTLGLSNDADKYEIKLAYRTLAKKWHPDINPAENATAQFQKINEAYEFLSDENIKLYKERYMNN